MRQLLPLLLLSFLATSAIAQDKTSNTEAKAARTVYGELGGPGILSINYDFRFKKAETGLGMRVGVGGVGFLTAGIFTMPVGLNYLAGKDGHYFEAGAGASLISLADGETVFEATSTTVFGYLNLGYRYQPVKKGFTGRIFVSPLIVPEAGFFPFYGGVSAGFKF
jgi:hypothetical protein